MKLKIEAASGIGSRMTQEDCLLLGEKSIETLPRQNVSAFFVDTSNKAPVLAAVLDGVGSCSYAALGSAIAGSKIQSAFYAEEDWFNGGSDSPDLVKQKLNNACMDACGKLSLLNRSFGGSIEAATTITAVAFSERQLHLWALGDSPAYLYRSHVLHPLFEPMCEGHRLLAFAGGSNTDFTASTYDLAVGDTIILSTDGISQKVLFWALRLGMSAQAIVRLSTAFRRYSDNATIIKIKVLEE